MTDVVTRLIVRADGSLATLDRFEKGMADAGKATDYASGAVASFETRMAAAKAATEKGLAVTTQTIARKTQEERAWEKWSSTVDRTTGLRIRLEREAAQAAVSAANAVNMGYASQEQALATLMALEQRHAAQLSAHIAAENNVAMAYNRTAQAADQAAMSTARLAAANQNSRAGAGAFNTGNVAAQFQDIGVTAAMGMSPMMIALQQGTQLSAVLGGQGLTGVVKTLGAAFASILSPVSLLTIGVVALAAWGIQAFMGMMAGADDATTSLEKHNEWLDEVLAGYDEVRDAAEGALESALKLPEASVASDLSSRQAEATERSLAAMEKVLALQSEFQGYAGYAEAFGVPDDVAASLSEVSNLIGQVSADAALSSAELDMLHVAFTQLANNTADQNIKDIANEALALVDAARQGSAEVRSLGASLDALPRDIQIRLRVGQEFTSATEGLQDLYMDPRSRFEIDREKAQNFFDQQMATAQSYSQVTGAASEYERVLESINAAEAEAMAKASAKGAKDAAKPFDQWSGNVASFQQRIASQQMEIDLMGKSTYEVERQKAAFDLLNQAKAAGIPITAQVTDEINLMSAQYAAATVELENAAKAQAAMEEQMNFYRSTFTGFFGELKAGLMEGKSFWESLGNAGANALDKIADRALSMAANGLFDMIFGAIMGGVTGGLGAGGTGFLGGGASSWGPSFAGGGYTGMGARAGGLDGMGGFPAILHPNETVIDHTRNQVANSNASVGDVIINNTINVPPGTSADVAPAIAREVAKELRKQIPDAIQAHNRNPLRRAS